MLEAADVDEQENTDVIIIIIINTETVQRVITQRGVTSAATNTPSLVTDRSAVAPLFRTGFQHVTRCADTSSEHNTRIKNY